MATQAGQPVGKGGHLSSRRALGLSFAASRRSVSCCSTPVLRDRTKSSECCPLEQVIYPDGLFGSAKTPSSFPSQKSSLQQNQKKFGHFNLIVK